MDWKYKHFDQQAVFSAPYGTVLEAARLVAAESLDAVQDTADGVTGRGSGVFHAETVTFHVAPVANGTQVAVELLAQRAVGRGYMLWDVGGYYNGQIDKWFSAIASRLGSATQPVLVSKSTSSSRLMPGCAAGCIAWVLVGACLTVVAIPLDRFVFPQAPATAQGPLTALASLVGLLVGIAAFLYVMYPDAPLSRSIRQRARRSQDKQGQ